MLDAFQTVRTTSIPRYNHAKRCTMIPKTPTIWNNASSPPKTITNLVLKTARTRNQKRTSYMKLRRNFLIPAIILVCFSPLLAWSQTAQSSTYTAIEAAKHAGENAIITDRVDGVHQSGKGNIFLNMGGKYPNQAFTAYIPAGSAGQFTDYRKYDGKTVVVSGKITLYRGKPEIIVTSPSQLSLK